MTTTSRRQTLLNQIIALEGGLKTRAETSLTRAYQLLEKSAPLSGIARSYRPRDQDGDHLPPESTQVQVRVDSVLTDVFEVLGRTLDVTLTKDATNCLARADLVVDDQVLLADVPVTFLMTLEKQLIKIRLFLSKLPVLDISEKWDWDDASNAWATPVTETTRTKKLPRNHVLAPATDKHPAQVQMYNEDVIEGYWATIKYSGAAPASRRVELLVRADKLIDAVRSAREVANTIPVTDREAGRQLFSYLLEP